MPLLLILSCCLQTAEPETKPVLVFLLAGQSNMEGQGVVDLDHEKYYNGGRGTLLHAMKNKPDQFRHIRTADGAWVKRDDVFVRFKARHGLMTGPLTIGYTGYPGNHHIGPEFQFGHVVGGHFDEPVVLIKTAWGGKSLYRDFRPPSSGGDTGPYYTQMVAEIRDGLNNIGTDFPALKGRDYRVAGFVWMQGWNDMVSSEATGEYAGNLRNLINDIRAEFESPTLPVVVGELGNGGAEKVSEGMQKFRAAQRQACGLPEFKGNVLFVPTTQFARPAEQSPKTGHGHHWFGNAESYFLIGDALGKGMLRLIPPEV